jgi:hypothetical protein
MATRPGPTGLTVRTYQVGFGDCFLLSFHYPPRRGRGQGRHVLIDFGTTKLGGKRDPKAHMLRIANDIKAVCGGKLTAVVATHRHQDHISGFATQQGKGPGDVIAGLRPEVVIQPWTEHPRARPDARKPPRALTGRQAFVGALQDMHRFAEALLEELQRLSTPALAMSLGASGGPAEGVEGGEGVKAAVGRRMREQLRFLGENNLKNKSAVENLMTLGRRHAYVHYGSRSGLEGLLPGVRVRVLGPPTLEQSAAIAKQRKKDPGEFWHFQATAGRRYAPGGDPLFPEADRYAAPPPQARWFVPRLHAARGDQLLEIVRSLDDAMNNTSVILLFEAGGKRFLFPGDAQVENWSYALKHKAVCKLLEGVDLYKVGHHGSLNATPKTLWGLFKHKSEDEGESGRLRSLVSTLRGKHGSVDRGTEVPRRKLLRELAKHSHCFSTEHLKKGDWYHDEKFELDGPGPGGGV